MRALNMTKRLWRDDEEIKSVINHETGHALKLSHPVESSTMTYSNKQSFPCIMMPVQKSASANTYEEASYKESSHHITNYDKSALIYKWGY